MPQVTKVQVHKRTDFYRVHIWSNPNVSPSRSYTYRGKGKRERAIALAEKIAAQHGIQYIVDDQTGTGIEY